MYDDQINLSVFFWYLVKNDLTNIQCTFYKVPEQHGHGYLVTLYKIGTILRQPMASRLRDNFPSSI